MSCVGVATDDDLAPDSGFNGSSLFPAPGRVYLCHGVFLSLPSELQGEGVLLMRRCRMNRLGLRLQSLFRLVATFTDCYSVKDILSSS